MEGPVDAESEVDFQHVYANAEQGVKRIADATAPDFSVLFLAAFLVIAYIHESKPEISGTIIVFWLLVQLFGSIVRKEFQNDLFWKVIGLFGNLFLYLLIGYCWSMVKLYIDIWQDHIPLELVNQIRECTSANGEEGCIFEFIGQMKWFIVRWMTHWPVSVIYTLSRDPLRIFTDMLIHWSEKRYLLIAAAAVRALDAKLGRSTLTDSSEDVWLIMWTFGFILGYVVLGYIWTHMKLFLDVWQKTLPAPLEAELVLVYRGDKNYWSFVSKIKWLVLQWLITWPFSIAYTILRHPARILADFVYQLSQRKYTWIVSRAVEIRSKE